MVPLDDRVIVHLCVPRPETVPEPDSGAPFEALPEIEKLPALMALYSVVEPGFTVPKLAVPIRKFSMLRWKLFSNLTEWFSFLHPLIAMQHRSASSAIIFFMGLNCCKYMINYNEVAP
jgi:hypothetical protein